MITNPFWRMEGTNSPMTVPKIEPMPPKRLVPPITTPAITFKFVVD